MKKEFDHVCFTTTDMEKSIDFYKNVLGLEIVHHTDEWSELKLNENINLALYKTEEKGVGLGFVVEDCKVATEELIEKGVKITKNCEKRDDGITLTHFTDVDGNRHWLVSKSDEK